MITPIPKVKGTTNLSELRPVHICPTIDKVIESLVKEQLYDHIHLNNLIDSCQSTYLERHLCETALNFVINNCIELRTRKMSIIAVFLDLSRAFETVDRLLLLDMLELNGIGGTVLKWFDSWLIRRKKFVKCNDTLSEPIDVVNGVPQGMPLAALPFILYLNMIVRRLRW